MGISRENIFSRGPPPDELMSNVIYMEQSNVFIKVCLFAWKTQHVSNPFNVY